MNYTSLGAQSFPHFRLFASLATILILLVSCQEDEEKAPALSITSFEPKSGLAGTQVIIHGTGFQTDITKNSVTFLENLSANIVEATATTLKVVVPNGAITGQVSVIVNSITVKSKDDFVIPPQILDFSPKSGVTGSEVIITGTGFSSTIDNNKVTFNNVNATVKQATHTSLTVEVPHTGSSGKIVVKVGDEISTSANNFVFLPHIVSLSAAIGAVSKPITITGSGFNTVLTENIVSFNGVTTPVISGNVNSLNVLVPPSAIDGIVSVSTNGATSNGPTFDVVIEAMHAGGSNSENGYSIAIDQLGNTYVTGSFASELTFGNTTLQPQGEDIFIVKYNNQAEVVWAKRIGDSGPDRGMSIAVDNNGNCYIGGYYSYHSFIAKLDANGTISWSSIVNPNSPFSTFSKIAIQGDNLYATGGFNGSLSVGSSNLVSNGVNDIIVAKFNKNTGAPIWAKNFGSTEDDNGGAMSVASDGNIYVAGSTFGAMVIGSTTLTTAGGLDAFIIKLNQDGDAVWAKTIAGTGWENALGLVLDEQENPVVTGYFTTSTTIGTTILQGVGNEDMFIAKFSKATGNLVWSATGGGGSVDHGESITSDVNGNIYVTGYYEFSASFGSVNIPNTTSSRDVFVAKYSGQGTLQWIKRAGGNETDMGWGIAISQDGIVQVTGFYRTFPILLENTTLNNAGSDDIFVWKIWQ